MTPDGISTADWNRVHGLALAIANASSKAESGRILADAKTKEMFRCLRALRRRYGDLPSILGTLGDYMKDDAERYKLYQRGVTKAQQLGDQKNLSILIESILELASLEADQRRFWKSRLRTLKTEPNRRRKTR